MGLLVPLIATLCVVVISSHREDLPDQMSHFQTVDAVFQPMGKVAFVRNLQVVQINCSNISKLINKLTTLLPKLDTILKDPHDKISRNEEEALIHDRKMIRHLIPRDNVQQSSSTSSPRNRRSILTFGGKLLHSLFGTATDDQVDRINRKVGRIIAWAKKKGKLISKMLDRGNDNAGKMRLLQSKAYWFEKITKTNIKRLDYTTYEVDLIIIYELVKMIVNTFQRLEQAITMTHCDIVTPNLILPGDLSEILLTAEKEYRFQPLYSMNQLTHYYSILHSCILGVKCLFSYLSLLLNL